MKWILGGLSALLVVGGVLLLLADTGIGHRLIADRIAALAPASGLKVRIGRIDGSIYGKAILRDVRVSDPKGVFFDTPEALLDWTPWRCLSNTLDIEGLTAQQARLLRPPQLNPGARSGPVLPDFDIRIGRLAITRIDIAAAVAGKAQHGLLTATANIGNGRALIDLAAKTDSGDRLVVKLDAMPDQDRFDIDGALDAPAGGVFGALLGTRLPVVARITGQGRWADWRGALKANAGGEPVANLSIAARSGRYDVEGNVIPSAVANGRIAALTGGLVRVKGHFALANRQLDTHVALASATFAAQANGVIDLGHNRFSGLQLDLRVLRPDVLFANMAGQNVQLAVRLNGEWRSAAFDYLLTADRVSFGPTGFDTVRASGQGRLSAPPVSVPLRLTARRVTGVGDAAGGILANAAVDGLLKVSATTLTGDNLAFRSDKLTARLTLLVDLATGRFDIGVGGALDRLLLPGLGVVDVKSRFSVVPGANGQGARVLGRGEAWVRRLDNRFLASLAGGLPHVETSLERQVDGTMRFTGLTLTAPDLRITGNGLRRPDGTIHFEGAGSQRRYGPVVLGLDGSIARPTIDLRLARPFEAAGLRDVSARLVPSAQGYSWQARGGSSIGPLTGDGAILLPTGGEATIDVARLDASGLIGRGRFRALAGGLEGQLALSGNGIGGTVALAPAGGGQRIEAHVTARDAKLVGPPQIAARRAQVDGVVLIVADTTSIDGTATGQGLRYGSLALARLAANARLRNGAGEVRAAFAGSRGRAFDLQTVAQLTPDRISIVGQGTIDAKPIATDNPAVLTRNDNGWTLTSTSISFAGGKGRLSGHSNGAGLSAEVEVSRLPLTVLDIVSPDLGLGGVASGRLSFNQPNGEASPTGRIDMRVRNLSRSGVIQSSQPIDVGIAGLLDGRGLAVRAIAASGGATIGQAQAQIAAHVASGDPVERLVTAPLFAQLRYQGPADTLWRLTGIETLDVSGPIAVGADVGGTVRAPQIKGSFQTAALRIESPVSGTVLTDVRASGSFGGSQLVIPSFTASAGRGTVGGRATFDLAAAKGFGIDIAAQARNAELIRRDDVAATVSGPLTIRSDGGSGVIAGDLMLDRSAFRLGRATATTALPQLNVREINQPIEAFDALKPPLVWQLAIKARADSRLAVTGLGLDSEWSTALDVGGTLDNPRFVGRADVVRGGYEFAGKRFELARGIIRFQGNQPPDPALDIEATATNQALSATVRVTGTGQRPDIAFSSTPSLPQEELLSRLLFGTSITNLSAPEAVQLAAAVASLQGGGTGLNPINALRQAIGLDRLRILPADATTGNKTAVAAGKYITRRTYVELVSDGQGYSASRVEFQITRWLSLLSTISTIGRTSATARVSKDY